MGRCKYVGAQTSNAWQYLHFHLTYVHFSPTYVHFSPYILFLHIDTYIFTLYTYIYHIHFCTYIHFPTIISPHTFSHMHTFSHIHFPTYIFPHTYTFFTYIFHIQMYVCDPKFHTYIHLGKNMYVPHTYVYVCKMFTDICSHTLVCTTLVGTFVNIYWIRPQNKIEIKSAFGCQLGWSQSSDVMESTG